MKGTYSEIDERKPKDKYKRPNKAELIREEMDSLHPFMFRKFN